MLEWYRVGWDHHRLMEETAELVGQALALVGRRATLRVLSYRELFQQHVGLDPFEADEAALRVALGDVHIDPVGLTRDDWLDLLMTHHIQPQFDDAVMTVVHDWPASQAALARIRPARRRWPSVSSCTWVQWSQRLSRTERRPRAARRFQRDQQRRHERGQVQPAVDEALLSALPSMPACAAWRWCRSPVDGDEPHATHRRCWPTTSPTRDPRVLLNIAG